MIEITVPRLGWSMEEGTFSAWLKNDGDWIEKGDLLFVLESDKASQEIESFESGLLRIGANAPRPGETVKVGQVIGYLTARDEASAFAPATIATPCDVSSDGGSSAPAIATGRNSDYEPKAAAALSRSVASPRARRAARDRGFDWRNLSGSGRDGRIRERDILAAASSPAKLEPAAAPLSSVRRTIAERMLASIRSTAPVTLTTKVHAANLVNLRDQFKTASPQAAPKITDIVIKLAAQALADHPGLNARWQDDRFVLNSEINIGLAVDTASGLMVPVIRNVPDLGLKPLAAVSRSLVERARENRLNADEMRGGTFTVTNLGMYGIDAFTPIINPPETAILGLGAIRREAVVLDDDRLMAAHVMTLSLTFDHRVVDGAPAARFLQRVVRLIENPAASLVG